MDGDHRGWWARHWQDVVYDVAPPVILLTLGLLDVYTGLFAMPLGDAPPVTALVPGTLACIALLFRRRRPRIVLATILLLVFVPPLLLPMSLTYWDEFVVWLVALYSCARHLPLRHSLVGLALSTVGMVALPSEFAEMRDVGGVVFYAVLVAAVFVVGLLTRSRAIYRRRAERAAVERALAEERARRAERGRIARELHDVISHTITVVVMQAGGARLAAARDPAVAVEALARIESLGQESLAELRTMLAVLRDDEGVPEVQDAPEPTAPQPGLGDLAALCERMRALGLPVRLRLERAASIPTGVQLSAYRVVQESLTNVLKHAGTVDTDVRIVRGSGGVLDVEISNAPPERPRMALDGAHRGLDGMHERVAAAGGSLEAAARADGGFSVHVRLPVGERVP